MALEAGEIAQGLGMLPFTFPESTFLSASLPLGFKPILVGVK
jgi:hypothetical protein